VSDALGNRAFVTTGSQATTRKTPDFEARKQVEVNFIFWRVEGKEGVAFVDGIELKHQQIGSPNSSRIRFLQLDIRFW